MSTVIHARIEEPICVARRQYPVTHGCPLPQGVLTAAGHLRLVHENGDELPLQTQTLATWPDGSIKWLLLDAQIDLRPRQIAPLRIEYGDDVKRLPFTSPLKVTPSETGFQVETGRLRMTLNNYGTALIGQAPGMDTRDSAPQMTLTDAEGTLYTGQIERLEVEEAHALRLVVRASGGFVSDAGARPMSWVVRFYFYAHQPFVRIYHTFVHDADEPVFFKMQELVFRMPLSLEGDTRIMTGSPKWTIAHGDDWGERKGTVSLWETSAGQYAIMGLPEGRIDRRVVSHGWIYAGDAERGIQLKLRHPAQNYPKRYTADENQIAIHLYPDPGAWIAPEERAKRYTELNLSTDGEYAGPLTIPQGMARTHEMTLYCGPAIRDVTEAAEWAAGWEFPLLLEIDSNAYAESGAMGPLPPFYPEFWLLESKLNEKVTAGMTGSGLSGMMNYGDTGLTTTENGLQKTLTTDNLGYDHVRAVLRQYLRRGDQTLFWQTEAMALHLMDVDTVHHSTLTPERTGGQRTIWSQFHHYTDTGRTELVTPRTSHVWFGGLIDFYHITGYRRALEVAGLTGRYCAGTRSRVGWDSMPADFRDRWDDPRFDMTVEGYPDWYSPRRAGWALTGIADLYEVNRDPTLADEMAAMVTVLSRWQDADGRWRSRFGAFARATEVFMVASILYGLERVWELTGNEKAKELLIRGCRFIATVTVTREGLMYYKEAPINAGPGSANILAFRPMVFAYRETGDAAILRAMWRQFRWMIEQGGPRGWEVKDALWALPLFREQGLLERWRDDGV